LDKKIILKKSVIAVALTLASSQLVLAQQAATDATIQKVLVTGSNIKRVEVEGSSQIQTITAAQIKATGANTIAELLHSIPSFGTGASVDFVDGGFAKGTATASLRNLGSSSTLILLNSRRISPSPYADPNQGKSTVFDLNSIPLSSIDRVEILLDGASAVYGSDAVAGVVNFITKKNYQGAELSANLSANDGGQFGRRNVSGIFGFGDLASQHYNGFVSVDLAERDSTKVKDVKDIHLAELAYVNARLNPFSSSLSDQPFFYRERTPGALNFSNSFARRADVINRTNCDASQKITGDRALHNLSATDTLIGRTFCNYNVNDYTEAQSEGKDTNVLGKFDFQISPTTTSFTEVGYNRIDRRYIGAPLAFRSTASTTTFTLEGAPTQFQVVLPVGHPDNPFPTSRAAVGLRLVNSTAGTGNLNEGYRFLTGLKGTNAGWDWDTGFLWNRIEREETFYGRLYKPTIQRLYTENRTIAATLADPTSTRDVTNKGYFQTTLVDLKGSTEFGKLGGGAIGLALGGEVREEKFVLTPDEQLQTGNIIGLVNSNANGKRQIRSAFVEFHAPFTKTFEVDLSGRYDKYPNIAASKVPQIGAKWTPNERFALRGTYGESFVAPALAQVSPGGVQSFQNVVDSRRCPDGVNPLPGADAVDCNKGVSSLSAANPQLKPETSKSYSLGFILTPTKNIDLLVTYYNIRKKLEVSLQGAQFVIDHPDLYPGKVIRDQNPANLLTDAAGNPIPGTGPISQVNRQWDNQGVTEVKGIDFEATMRNSFGDAGKLNTKLALNYQFSYKRAERPGDREVNVAGSNGGIADFATSAGDQPRIRANLATTWTKGVHALTGSVNYVDTVSLLRKTDNFTTYPVPYCHYGRGQPADATQLGGLPRFSDYNSDCEIGSWTTFNLNYAYSGFKNTIINFNIQNIFDTPAPYDPNVSSSVAATGVGFNTNLHNGFGRYFKLSLNYKFK
jgi:iron complex outermembrane receptor protein